MIEDESPDMDKPDHESDKLPQKVIYEYSDDELIAELAERFDHVVFSGIKTEIRKKGQSQYIRRWRGNCATCIGLCFQLQSVINDEHFRTSYDSGGHI